MTDLMASGLPRDSALEESLTRIYSAAPGQYGAGVNVMIRNSKWEDRKEIGDYYIQAGGYSYRPISPGKLDSDSFRRRMYKIEATVKNSTSREYDMIDNDDVFMYLGGFNAAVESVTGKRPMSFIGCSADTSKPVTRTIGEECRFIFRSKVLNPRYAEGLKVHGFRGATEIKHMFEYVFAWDATSDIIEDWMYEVLAKEYLLKDEVRGWMQDANPYAVHDMLKVLMEAMDRGMWDPSEEMRESLKELYLENEELMEGISDR
jgi:cobaltochelatase CobN